MTERLRPGACPICTGMEEVGRAEDMNREQECKSDRQHEGEAESSAAERDFGRY